MSVVTNIARTVGVFSLIGLYLANGNETAAGAIYFVTTAWTTMTGTQQKLVVVGGIELLGVLLCVSGRLLNRGGTLPEVERVLLIVVAFLLPVACAAAGELCRASVPLGLPVALAVLGSGFVPVRALARHEEPALHPVLVVALTGLCALVLIAHTGEEAPASASTAAAAALLLAVVTVTRTVVPRSARPEPVLLAGLLLAFATAVLAGDIAYSARDAAPLGVVVAAFGVGAALLEASLVLKGLLKAAR